LADRLFAPGRGIDLGDFGEEEFLIRRACVGRACERQGHPQAEMTS
jgi:hypothetical protein